MGSSANWSPVPVPAPVPDARACFLTKSTGPRANDQLVAPPLPIYTGQLVSLQLGPLPSARPV